LKEIIFSHALRAQVKKILPKVYRYPNLWRGYRLGLGSTGCQSATGQIRGGEPVLFGGLAEKRLKGSEPKCFVKRLRGIGKLPLPRRGGFPIRPFGRRTSRLRQGYGGRGDRRSLRRRFAPSLISRQSPPTTDEAEE